MLKIIFVISISHVNGFFVEYRPTTGSHNQQVWSSTPKAESCKWVVVGGYMNWQCLIEGFWYFRCPFSTLYYQAVSESCDFQIFTDVCPNDTTFYQVCGHQRDCVHPPFTFNNGQISVCGDMLCQVTNVVDSTDTMAYNLLNCNHWHGVTCDGKLDCLNSLRGSETSVDEDICDGTGTVMIACVCELTGDYTIHPSKICYRVCDCRTCSDEANCHNLTVGIFCESFKCENDYLQPNYLCNGKRNCKNGMDEENCGPEITCPITGRSGTVMRALLTQSMCSANTPLCSNFRDQMNCTGSLISPLICDVQGYPTTISEKMECEGHRLCDDGLDDECVKLGVLVACMIHKHRLCDGRDDCSDGDDESMLYCKDMTMKGVSCVRKLSYSKEAVSFPASWIMDGVVDCIGGIDEQTTAWALKCGTGIVKEYELVERARTCKSGALKCPRDETFLMLPEICKGLSNCDRELCNAARDRISIVHQEKGMNKFQYCIPGLSSMIQLAGDCEMLVLNNEIEVYGGNKIYYIVPQYLGYNVNCLKEFGRSYVYMACSGKYDQQVTCPLRKADRQSCFNLNK